jgi:hypothetical protein
MEADYDIFEMVAVTNDFWLFDAECYQRRYSTDNGQPLTPGYYVVNWPEHSRIRRFTKNAAFHGPFTCRKQAQATLDLMRRERTLVFLRMSAEKPSGTVPKTRRLNLKKATVPFRLATGENETASDRIMA